MSKSPEKYDGSKWSAQNIGVDVSVKLNTDSFNKIKTDVPTLAPKDVSITQLQANPEVVPMTPKERMDWLRDRTKSMRESTNMSHAEAMKTNTEFHTVRTNIRKIRNRLKQIEKHEGNTKKQAELQAEIQVLRNDMASLLRTFQSVTPRTFEHPYVDAKHFEIRPDDIVSYTTEAGVTVQARVRSAMGSDLYGIEWQENGKLTTMTVLRDAITFSKKRDESIRTNTSSTTEQSNTVEVPIPSVARTDTNIVSESSVVQENVDSKTEKVGTIARVRTFLAGWREKKLKNNEAQLAAENTVLNEKIIAIVSKRNKRARTVALAALLLLVGIHIGKQTNKGEDVSKPPTTIENVEKGSVTKPAVRYEIPTYGNTVTSPTKSPRIIDLKSGYQPAPDRVESSEKLTPQSQKNAALDKQYLDNPDAFIAKRGTPDLKDLSVEVEVSDSASEEFPPHPSNVENSEEERSSIGVDDAEYEEEEFPPHPSNIEVDDEGYEESQAVQVESISPGSYLFPSGIGTNEFVDSIVSEFYTDNVGRFDAVGNTNSEAEYQRKAHELLESMRTYKTENAAVVQEMGISSGDIDNIKPGEVVNMNSFLALLKY
jgi:hypothetical protein